MELAACVVHRRSSLAFHFQAERVVSCVVSGASVQLDDHCGRHRCVSSMDLLFPRLYVAVHDSVSVSGAREMVSCGCIGRVSNLVQHEVLSFFFFL